MEFSKQQIKNLVFPLIIEQLLAVSVGMIDTYMVSTCGQAALSGTSLVDNINRLFISIFAAFSTGGVVICSQYSGAKNIPQAKTAAAQLELIQLVFSIFSAIIFCIFPSQILGLIFSKIDKDVMNAAVTYLIYTALSYPFLALYNSGAAVFRSVGNSKISMKINLFINILNIILNAFFVFGLGMSVSGVGLATLLSRAAGSFVMKYFVMSERNPLRSPFKNYLLPQKNLIFKILKIGIPSGIENSMFQIGKLAVVGMIATLGNNAIAANAIGYQIIDFPNIPGMAIGLALVTVTGQSIGAGQKETAVKLTKNFLKMSYIGDWSCKILLFFTAPFLVSLFSLSEEAAQISVTVLRMFSVASLPCWSLSFTLPNALRGAGDVKFVMIVSLLSMWICRIGASYILAIVLKLGVYGVWLGMFADWYVRSAFFTVRFLRKRWLEKSVL